MKIRRIIMPVLLAAIMLSAAAVLSFAQNVPIARDDGSGSAYDALPVNYVQITNLDFATATIESGEGYRIESGYIGSEDLPRVNLVWSGKLSFGSSNTTNDSDASLKANALPDITLRFPDGARLSDGTYCDIKLTLSEIRVRLGASRTDKINNNTKVQLVIGGGWGGLSAMPPRTSHQVPNATSNNGNNAGCTIANKFKITMKVVEKGTDTPVSNKYPSMLVMFTDLDGFDKTIKRSSTPAHQANGPYSEGIELVSGWIGNIVLAPNTDDLANTLLVNTMTTTAGNTRIKSNGAKLQEFLDAFDPPAGDYNTLWSGFIGAVEPQEFSFYWTGSMSGTSASHGALGSTIGGQPTIAVNAKRNNPGADGASLGGDGTYSGVDSWYTNTHLMNSSAKYDYKPAPGWYVKSLKVDDVAQTLSESQSRNGGSYTFPRLNKYPLPERDIRNGQMLIAEDSGIYTIEASFARIPEFRDTKSSDTPYVQTYEDKVITYTITSEELYDDAGPGTHEIRDNMANGLLILQGEPTVSVSGGTYVRHKADNTGLHYTFRSNETGHDGGARPKITIKYRARINWDKYFASGAKSVKNTCNGNTTETKVLSSLKIIKSVKGNLGDITKKFGFTAMFAGMQPNTSYKVKRSGAELKDGFSGDAFTTDSNGKAEVKFLLRDGDSLIVNGIPQNSSVVITEDRSDHYPAYKVTSSDGKVIKEGSARKNTVFSTGEVKLDKANESYSVEFINTRDLAPVTGIAGITDGRQILVRAITVAAGLMAVYALQRAASGRESRKSRRWKIRIDEKKKAESDNI